MPNNSDDLAVWQSDYDSDNKWQYSPGGLNSGVVSEYVQKINKKHVREYPTASGGINSKNYVTFKTFMCPDDSEAGWCLSDGRTFQYDDVGGSGVAAADLNGYTMTFSGMEADPMVSVSSGDLASITN